MYLISIAVGVPIDDVRLDEPEKVVLHRLEVAFGPDAPVAGASKESDEVQALRRQLAPHSMSADLRRHLGFYSADSRRDVLTVCARFALLRGFEPASTDAPLADVTPRAADGLLNLTGDAAQRVAQLRRASITDFASLALRRASTAIAEVASGSATLQASPKATPSSGGSDAGKSPDPRSSSKRGSLTVVPPSPSSSPSPARSPAIADRSPVSRRSSLGGSSPSSPSSRRSSVGTPKTPKDARAMDFLVSTVSSGSGEVASPAPSEPPKPPPAPAGPPPARLLWLHGPPGSGKSVLVAELCALLLEQGQLGAVHFCDSALRERSDLLRIVTSIAFQLAAKLPAYRAALTESLQNLPDIHALRTKYQVRAHTANA